MRDLRGVSLRGLVHNGVHDGQECAQKKGEHEERAERPRERNMSTGEDGDARYRPHDQTSRSGRMASR